MGANEKKLEGETQKEMDCVQDDMNKHRLQLEKLHTYICGKTNQRKMNKNSAMCIFNI